MKINLGNIVRIVSAIVAVAPEIGAIVKQIKGKPKPNVPTPPEVAPRI